MFVMCCVIVSLLLAPGSPRVAVEFTKDSIETVRKNVADGKAVLVDVRDVEEWNDGHVDGAIFVPANSLRKHSLDPKKLAKLLPKKKVLYTYCVVVMRAKATAKVLQQQGYSVRALKPGYDELIEGGFTPDVKKTDDDSSR